MNCVCIVSGVNCVCIVSLTNGYSLKGNFLLFYYYSLNFIFLLFGSSVVRVFVHFVMGRQIDPSWGGPIELYHVPSVLHDWCNKGRGMCYLVCGMVHVKEPLLLFGKSSPCASSCFPLSLSEWSFTICPTPYNRKQNVLSASLNKTFPSFLINVV